MPTFKPAKLPDSHSIKLVDKNTHTVISHFYCFDHCKNGNRETSTCCAYCEFMSVFLEKAYAQTNPNVILNTTTYPGDGLCFNNYKSEKFPNSTEEIFNEVKQDFNKHTRS